MASSRNKSAKVKIVASLPALEDAEVEELFYDSTNGKLALRTINGYIYFTKDT